MTHLPEDLSEYCAPGVRWNDRMVDVSPGILLRLITFVPPAEPKTPPVIFVAGWISLIRGWREVLREMSKDFTIYYIETREKISSSVHRHAGFGVHEIAGDIAALSGTLGLQDGNFVLMGSSLGATAILEGYHDIHPHPQALILIGPNATFRVPVSWKIIITFFYPPLYTLIRPPVKWYLKKFRLNVNADRAQYEKYSEALDAADPWKLKKAVKAVWSYQVWDVLSTVDCPVLVVNASKDKLHEPEVLRKMTAMIPRGKEIDLETNAGTHSSRLVDEVRKYLFEIG